MDLAQLEAFLEAARWGSFRRAAEALYLTQPSLSERIKRLEEELGQPLFIRMGRGVRLTEAGRSLLPYAERALSAVRQAREAMEAFASTSAGHLHIGTARVIGTYVLPEILLRFRRRHPGVEVTIRTGRSSHVLQMVVTQEVQVGLCRALYHPEVDTLRLYDEEIVLVVYPEHPFAQAGSASIYAVAREPLILYDRESSYFVLIDRVCRDAGIVPRVLMNLDSIEATKRMVESGMGISFLPRSAIRREVEAGTLVVVPLQEGHRVTLPTAVLVHRKQPITPAVRAFLALLRETFTPEPQEAPAGG